MEQDDRLRLHLRPRSEERICLQPARRKRRAARSQRQHRFTQIQTLRDKDCKSHILKPTAQSPTRQNGWGHFIAAQASYRKCANKIHGKLQIVGLSMMCYKIRKLRRYQQKP